MDKQALLGQVYQESFKDEVDKTAGPMLKNLMSGASAAAKKYAPAAKELMGEAGVAAIKRFAPVAKGLQKDVMRAATKGAGSQGYSKALHTAGDRSLKAGEMLVGDFRKRYIKGF